MRWHQILKESLSKYRPMFTGLYPDGKVPRYVEMQIQKIERIMQREDRVVWMLRWYRFSLATEIVSDFAQPSPDDRKLLDRAKRDLGEAKGWNDSACLNEADRAYNYLDDFEHLWGMPIAAIQRYVFDRQLPTEIIEHFNELEQEWQDNIADKGVKIRSGDEKIIDFGNGWVWWHLDRPFCKDEGNAMGHCGNHAAYESGDTLLSLRQHIHEDLWEPHLTFILDRDHFLGEMKGKGNEKPVERYHSMIIALLENDIVFGLKGGGYLPENNFSLSDLSRDEQKHLEAMKPGFRSLTQLAEAGDVDALKKVISTRMSARGWSYSGIDVKNNRLIITHYKSLEYFLNISVDNYNETFNEVRNTLEYKYPKDGSSVYEQFYDDYYLAIIEDHLYDFCPFKADIGVEWHGLSGPVETTINFDSLEDCFDGSEDSPNIDQELDEIDDNYSFDDRNNGDYIDDIDEKMCKLISDDRRRSGLDDFVDEIHDTYSGNSKYSNGTPTQNHPDQLRFDF